MNYTRTALGLLSAQYRSVLKKCFLINLGLFALGAVTATPAMATETCPAGYKCYGENFGDAAEKYPEGHAHAGEMITLADMVKSPYTGYNTKEIWSGDYSSNGQITINHASGGELIIRNSTIDMNNNVGFVLQGLPPVNASLTLHLLNTEIKNGQVAQWGAGFYDAGKYYVQGSYGHNQIFENVTFTNNRVTGANSTSYGGALYIKGGNDQLYPQADTQIVKAAIISTGDKRTEFNQNYVSNNNVSYYAFGGGLYNCNSELSLLDADFTGNYTKSAYMAASEDQFGSAGGAIINHLTIAPYSGSYYLYYGRGIINQIYGTYTGNYSTWVDENKPVFAGGGAIFNAATIGDIGSADKKAVFTGNYAKGNAQNASHVAAIGGAIANYGDPNISLQYTSSSTAKRYQGGTSGLGKIGNIYADFTDNYVQSVHNASQGARGGALANFKKNPLIGNITGNFTNNQVLTATNGGTGKVVASGGAISNEGIMGNVTGDFRENKSYNDGNSVAVGGAIYNVFAIGYRYQSGLQKIGGIINSNFYDNVAESTNGYAFGGAIFTAEDLMIKADNGTSVFKGNKTISKSALADKEEKNEAIYVNKTSSTPSPLLELVAVNGGTLTFYDSIDGSSGYRAHLTGDADSHINLYNDIKSAFITADSTNISTADGNIKEYSMYNLVADNTAKWTIDFSVEGEEADAFRTTTETEAAGKVVLIDHFNLTDKAFNEITNKNFKVQILKTQGTAEAANLQLALSTQAAGELGGEFVVTQEKNTTKEAVTENTDWSHDFRETGTIDTTYGTLGLATKDTLNDSIGLTTRNESTDYDESLGDTLMLVNTADLAKRNFNADQATYKVRDGNDDIGTTHAGELNINGQGKDVSTLDGNGAALFDLAEAGTTVSLNDVKVTNAATVATLSASDAKLNLNNTEISGNNGEITANAGTIKAVNTNFYDNSGTEAGAIVSSAQVKIIADNGTSEIKGNTAGQAASTDTAIYMKSDPTVATTPQLNIEAKNNGVVTIYDIIDGDNPYTVAITGDASGKVQLYNDINNADVSVEKVHIETTDDNGESHNYKLNSLNSNVNAGWTIDFDVNAQTADNFETASTGTSGGQVTLEALNLASGQQYSDITDDTFKVQILKTQGTATAADLQLALTDALKTELATKFVMDEQDVTVDDPVNADTDWSHEYKRTVTTTTKKGWLDLATSDTLNDSIGIYTEETSVDTKSKLDDTLKLVNTANLETRNFNADTATYTVSDGLDDIGTTHAGELNVNGQGKDVSTLDGNGAALFDLAETGTTVSLNDVKVTNAATVATLSASDAKLNLNNAEISDNNGEITANAGTIKAVNTNFYDNSGTEAGAIVSSAQVKIVADNGTSEIKGNTAGQATSANTAIYMKSDPTVATTPQLNIEAKNNGIFTLRDSVDGDAPYAADITGDATGTVRLYNDVKKADVSVDTVNMELNDGTVKDYSVNTLTSDASAKWSVDVDVENKKADRFVTAAETPQSGSVVTLEHFEQKNGNLQDVRDENFKVQILKTQGTEENANLQLALSDDAKAELGDEFILEHRKTGEEDSVTTDTKWSRKLYRYTQEYTKYGQLGLATTDTLNDSIGMNTRETDVDSKESLGDTLKLVNQAELDDKNFIADTADEVYTLEDDLGETYGNLTINGVADGEQKSTVDLNGHDSFAIPENASLTLNDVVIKGKAPLSNAGNATFNNADVEGEVSNNGTFTAENSKLGTVTNEKEATITGSSVNNIINSGVVNLTNTEFTSIDGNDGVVNMWSDVDLSAKKVSNNALVLQGVKATVTKQSFGENVDLIAESGSEVNVGNNLINLRQATFGKGSQLTLNVDNLRTFGGIRADAFDIANGAKLDITFGQNPLDGKKTGEVALLSLSDGSDINNNNFKDVFHNNMYGFARKSEKSGIYEVYQTKTAREVSQENDGTQTNQDAAGAWVDGPSHGNPTAQSIANDLARLAQTDGVEFNKVLTALAPNDDGMAQTALIDLTDRLLLTVDNHLIKSYLDSGLSSGDGKPDLSNVKAWVKTYYAKSKMKNHGGTYGYDADDRGFIAGVDRKIASATKVGIGMQFDDTDVNAFRRDVNIQTIQGYVYGEYRPSNWFANGVLSYGTADYDEDKHIIGHNIAAHYKANIYSVQGLTGYTFQYFTPELGARYYKIKRHGYVDGAMQSVSGNDMDLLRTTLGIKAEATYGIFKPNAYADVMYDVISDSDDAVVSLPNGTSYTVNGKKMPRFGVEFGVGTNIALNDHAEIGVGYEAKFRKHYQDHSGWLSFKYTF